MKRVTFICSHLGKGGAERVMCLLINNCVKMGWDVQVIMLYENLIDYPVLPGAKIECLAWKKSEGLGELLYKFKTLRRRVTGDYVVSFLYVPIVFTVFSTLGMKKRVIVSERGDPAADPEGWAHQLLRTTAYYFADAIVFQTKQAKDFFSPAISKKGVIIPNPISDNIPDRYVGQRKKTVVAAGRLDKQKNFPLLIRAFAKLHREKKDYRLKIFGQGPDEEALKNLVDSLGLGEAVDFPGFVRDVDQQMRDAALYVSSSDYEGISNSMLEALAMGVPTVCTDCRVGGAREMIEDGVSGLLVPTGNEERLYQAMKRILDNPSYASELTDHAVEIREKLSEETIIPQWIKVIEQK